MQSSIVCLSNSFSNSMFISKKIIRSIILVTIHSFSRNVYFSDIKICSHSLLPTHFLSVYFKRPVTLRQASYWRQASHWLYWNESSHMKQQNDFFRTPTCLEELRLSNNYFLVTNTFSDQLLLEYKYFFSTATVMCRRSYFLRISNYSKHVATFLKQAVLPYSYFFRRITFLGAGISWEESLFLNS